MENDDEMIENDIHQGELYLYGYIVSLKKRKSRILLFIDRQHQWCELQL